MNENVPREEFRDEETLDTWFSVSVVPSWGCYECKVRGRFLRVTVHKQKSIVIILTDFDDFWDENVFVFLPSALWFLISSFIIFIHWVKIKKVQLIWKFSGPEEALSWLLNRKGSFFISFSWSFLTISLPSCHEMVGSILSNPLKTSETQLLIDQWTSWLVLFWCPVHITSFHPPVKPVEMNNPVLIVNINHVLNVTVTVQRCCPCRRRLWEMVEISGTNH